MAIQTVTLGLGEMTDNNALNEAMRALTTIDGVEAVEFEPEQNRVLVRYDTTKTSEHAFTAALSTVEYIAEPLPFVAPANPNNDRTLVSDLEKQGKL